MKLVKLTRILIIPSFVLGVVFSAAAMPMASYPGKIATAEYVPHQVIVRLKPASPRGSLVEAQGAMINESLLTADLQQRFNLGESKKIRQSLKSARVFLKVPQSLTAFAKADQTSFFDNLYLFKTNSKDIPALARRLAKDPNVVYAEPDYIVHPGSAINDPYFNASGSWGQPYMDLWGLWQMDIESVWRSVTGAGVVVAVVDTGVSFSHPDLLNASWKNAGEIASNGIDDDSNGFIDDSVGYDFLDNDIFPSDTTGHGTHVAGTIAATGNNRFGVIGVAYNTKIMALRGLSETGGSLSGLLAAIAYAVDNGAKVINNSWGFLGFSKAANDAVKYAYDNNVIAVFAAGNNTADTLFFPPANSPGAITVAASTVANTRAAFSNWGHEVDIAAPGEDILSINVADSYIAKQIPNKILDVNFLRLAGTSMAAPHIAGLAALLLEAKPDLSVDQFRSILRESASPWQEDSFLVGPGVANAMSALAMIQQHLPYANTFADITSPVSMTLANNKRIQLRGTAKGPGFSHYEIQVAEVFPADDLTKFTLGTFTTVATSGSPVTDSVLADIDSSMLKSGSIYLFKLKSYDANGAANESGVHLLIDSSLKANWPVNFSGLYENLAEIYSPVLADVDGDGKLDIITVSNRGIEAVDHSGKSLPGFPVTVGATIVATPTVVDVDGDGKVEIMVATDVFGNSTGSLYMFDNRGQLKPGFPTLVAATDIDNVRIFHLGAPIATDLNGDGRLDILSSQVSYGWVEENFVYRHRLLAVDSQGKMLPGYPKPLSYFANSYGVQSSVHDINRDGREDIVTAFVGDDANVKVAIVASNLPATHIANTNFTAVQDMLLYRATENGAVQLALAGISDRQFKICVYTINTDYTLTQQWEQALPSVPYHMIAHDMDGDNQLELMVGVNRTPEQRNDLWAFDLYGELMPQYPLQVFANFYNEGAGPAQHFSVAKLATEPNGILLFAGVNASMEAIDMKGNKLSGWPKQSPYFQNGGDATVGDIDDDGTLEVIVNNYAGSAYAWELGKGVPGPQPWGTRSADNRRTNFIAPVVYRGNFASMNIRGTFNRWGSAPMTLVSDHQWQIRLDITQGGESFKFDALGNWLFNWGDNNQDKLADARGGNILALTEVGSYIITFNDSTLKYSVVKKGDKPQGPEWQRTIVFIYGKTQPGQDMFIRGGLDSAQAKKLMGKDCSQDKWLCAIPITHLGTRATLASHSSDHFLDWYGREDNQGNVEGSPLFWTTDLWPASWGSKKTVAIDGVGEDPQNTWGQHYWKLDVMMDCSKTYNGWFEVKSYIANGAGWEGNISQSGAPYPSHNHFGKCGKINKFVRGSGGAEFKDF